MQHGEMQIFGGKAHRKFEARTPKSETNPNDAMPETP
jgi:hypothetical protein